MFWEDRWIDGEDVATIAPYLHQRISRRVRRTLTVRQGLQDSTWVRCISGGLSVLELTDYLHLWASVGDIHLGNEPDRTIWRWTTDGCYTAKSAYDMMHSGSIRMSGHTLIWKTWAPLRIKIFIWLAMKRRHWTGNRRARHGLEAHELCYLCDQGQETIDHIIAVCPFTREVWYYVLQALGQQVPPVSQTTLSWWRRLRSVCTGDRRNGMDSLFALVSWQLWKERNARCFRESTSSVGDLLHIIKNEADRWIQAGASGLRALAQG